MDEYKTHVIRIARANVVEANNITLSHKQMRHARAKEKAPVFLKGIDVGYVVSLSYTQQDMGVLWCYIKTSNCELIKGIVENTVVIMPIWECDALTCVTCGHEMTNTGMSCECCEYTPTVLPKNLILKGVQFFNDSDEEYDKADTRLVLINQLVGGALGSVEYIAP